MTYMLDDPATMTPSQRRREIIDLLAAALAEMPPALALAEGKTVSLPPTSPPDSGPEHSQQSSQKALELSAETRLNVSDSLPVEPAAKAGRSSLPTCYGGGARAAQQRLIVAPGEARSELEVRGGLGAMQSPVRGVRRVAHSVSCGDSARETSSP